MRKELTYDNINEFIDKDMPFSIGDFLTQGVRYAFTTMMFRFVNYINIPDDRLVSVRGYEPNNNLKLFAFFCMKITDMLSGMETYRDVVYDTLEYAVRKNEADMERN